MNPAATKGIRFHHGSVGTPARAVHTVPLGYDRERVPIGARLPIPASAELVDRLSGCGDLVVSFEGKLGDTLLAFAGVRALLDWLRMRSVRVAVRAVGPYRGLIARAGLITRPLDDAPSGRLGVIGDRSGVEACASQAAVSVVLDSAGPPCWAADGRAHPDLPARHYLALERRLGIRLPNTAPFTCRLSTGQSDLVEELRTSGWFGNLSIAAITATSWPERKDFTAERYIAVAEQIGEALLTQVRLLLVGGTANGGVGICVDPPRTHVRVLRLDGMPAEELTDVFAQCRLVMGNDTGLTHLAAMAGDAHQGGPSVVCLCARHSHSKWRTGLPHHHALATDLSDRMHQGDLCPVRDVIAPESNTHMDAFPTATVAQAGLRLLKGAKR